MSYTPRRRGTYPPLNSQSYYQDYHPSSRRPTVRSYTVRSSRGYESAHEAPRSSREHESAHEAPYSSYYNRRERRLSRRPRSQSTRQREYPYAFASEGARPSADDIKVTYDDPEDTRKHDNARDTRADETIEVEYETDSEEKRRRRRASKKKSRQEEDTSRSTKGRPYWEDPSEWWVREDGRFRMPPPPMGDHIVPAETEPEDDSANVDTNDDDHPQEAPESQRQTYPRYKTFIASKSSRGPLEKVQYSPSEAEGLGNWRLIDIEFKDVCYEDTMRGEMTRIPWTKARVPVNVKWDQQPVNSWLDHVPTVSIINDLFSDVPDEMGARAKKVKVDPSAAAARELEAAHKG
ncbi:hypothetical protein L202_07970 [Cryptococcus amylolentus CBS 6039]|uniref:Uncharacterized protein n=1 Tax=Cryptococcus amylolentus CBS 6039 TaxID=1295533 RepID=A0A1E3HCF6_9TREE|nr:hypothetical protein L202_07970 [Cryptococcus amylolentus CBS 6039]ODN73456.1 hypothetical protein L202_07970 [Cryptococcus amylolentus CBS 6039]